MIGWCDTTRRLIVGRFDKSIKCINLSLTSVTLTLVVELWRGTHFAATLCGVINFGFRIFYKRFYIYVLRVPIENMHVKNYLWNCCKRLLLMNFWDLLRLRLWKRITSSFCTAFPLRRWMYVLFRGVVLLDTSDCGRKSWNIKLELLI